MTHSRTPLTRRPTLHVLPLEARLMFDAAAATDAVRTTDLAVTDLSAVTAAPAADTAPAALSLLHTATTAPGGTAQAALDQALSQVNATLSRLPSQADFAALLQQSFGAAGTDAAVFAQRTEAVAELLRNGGLHLQVELRSNAELAGAYAAYAARGPDGTERIYLNADWLGAGASEAALTRVLLEEAGHALDQRLNAGIDTPGDEGERFSALARGETLDAFRSAALDADADEATLTLDGVQIQVEHAELSVPFPEGFIGTQGTSSGKANDILNFSTLGIIRASFFQDSGTGSFATQGNDISGGLRLTLTSGEVITLNGAINWRETQGSTLYAFGFIPTAGMTPVSFSYGGGSTYTIDGTSNFGLEVVGVNYSAADHSDVSGNAATSGLLDALNAYLAQVQANAPGGSVTAAALSTSDTTPTLTGSATLGSGETLSVEVNGIAYTTGNGLSLSGGTWSLTLPGADSLALGTYSITATITNSSGYTLTDVTTSELVITAPDTTAPVVSAGQTLSYSENRTTGAVLGTVTASDTVGVTAWRFGSTGTTTSADGYFSIAANGQISLTSAGAAAGIAANDFETTPNSFTHAVQAGDAAGNWSSAVNVALSVTDADEIAPVLTGPGSATGATSAKSISENTTAVHLFTASEPVTWSIDGGADAARFAIDAGGNLRFVSAPNFEAPTDTGDTANNNTYVVVVKATDANGNASTQTVTVTVLDVDDTAPVVSGGQTFSYNENRAAGALLGTVTASDAVGVTAWRFGSTGTATSSDGYFSITANGQISLTSAGDAAGNWSTAVNVTLSVTDVDDTAPVVSGGQSFSYNENRAAGALLGTVTASDAVGVTAWRFGSTGTATSSDGYFSIAANGQISLTSAGAAAGIAANDYETTPNSFTHAVQAGDAAGNWSSAVDVTLSVADVSESVPVANDAAQVAEDTPATGNVLSNDGRGGSSVVSFSVGNTTVAAGSTLVLEGVGSLTIAADGSYSFTPAPNWHGTVPTISYLTSFGDTASLTLQVTPVNDAPTLPPQALDTFQDSARNGQLPAITDADGDRLAYALVQGPAHGTLTLAPDGSYRYTPAEGYHGTDRFEVELSDGQGGTVRTWVEVNVTPAPTLGLPATSDLGAADNDRRTSADIITLAGTGSPGQTLALYRPDGTPLATVTVDAQGQWSLPGVDMSRTVGDAPGARAGAIGTYTFSVRAVLADGSESPAVALAIEREAGAAPVTPPPAAAPSPAPVSAAPAAAPEAVKVAAPTEALPTFDSALRNQEGTGPGLIVVTPPAEPLRTPPAGPNALDTNTGDIYTRPSGFQIMVNPAPEASLKLFRGLDDQVVPLGRTMNVQVPADTFIHTNINETVILQATLADGRPLPAWLRFDGKAGTLVGEVPDGARAQDLVVRVIARDSQGREAIAMMRLKLGESTGPGASLSRQLMQGHGTRALDAANLRPAMSARAPARG